MNTTSLFARLAAFGAAVAVSFSVVVAIADYGLPEGGPQLLVKAKATTVVR